jgi:hypothetical protein
VILSGITVTNNDTGMILAGATTYSFGNNRIGGNFAGNGGFGMGSAPLQ